MLKKFTIIFVFILFGINFMMAQASSGKYKEKSFVTYEEDFNDLYRKCSTSKLDSIHRICIVFMKSYGIRNDEKKLNSFCNNFIQHCEQDNNEALKRRVEIIQLTNKLKISYAPTTKLNTSFKKLFTHFFNEGDTSAALECLYEQAMIYDKRNETIETLKILFFCENFAINYNLQKDLCYQSVLHRIGYLLLNLEKNKPAIYYLKKSLETKNSIVMDSLVSLNGIGISYQKLGNYTISNTYFNKASTCALNSKKPVFNTVIFGNIAVNKFKLGKLNESYQYAYLDKNSSIKNNLWENSISAMYWLTQIELKRNNISHAKVLLDSINLLVKKTRKDDYAVRKKQNEVAYLYYVKIKNPEKALLAYQQYICFENLFQTVSNKDKISMLEIKAKSDVFNLEMVKIESRKKTKDIIITIFLVLLGLLSIYLFYFFRKKLKKSEKVKSEITELNIKQTEEIDRLKKTLLNQLELIKNDNSNFQNKQEDIKALKEFNLSQKEQWESFKNLFFSTYPTFQSILDLKLGKTSNGELRLIMLHKLGLNNKEISQSLFISIDGVKKANYRLYKKMNLKTSQELIDFFN